MPRTTLRVGICGCIPQYRGKIAGSEVKVVQTRRDGTRTRRVFNLKEVVVSEHETLTALRAHRCHFFVDVHPIGGHPPYKWFWARVVQITFVSNGVGRGEKMYRGGAGVNIRRGAGRESWNSRRYPVPQRMVSGIRNLLEKMSMEKLDRWLALATRRR